MTTESPELLSALCPAQPTDAIDWERIEQSPFKPWIRLMAQTPQEPKWHAEGDVWTHTRMVCEALVRLPAYQALTVQRQHMVFVAALLHDVAKPACTRLEDGRITSPNHSVAGARLARTILWTCYELCGTSQRMGFRETVCALIRNHSVPQHVLDRRDPTLKLRQMASIGALTPDYTNALLAILAEADARGKLCDDQPQQLDNVRLFELSAQEAGCLDGTGAYPSDFSRHAYLSERGIQPGQELYDDTWGTITMLCGLPGTGKDTYLRENLPQLPVVSLDALRQQMDIAPDKPQAAVISAAKEQAAAYLRKRQPFAWNATDLSPMLRGRLTQLFSRYGASTHMVYLETGWQELHRRNVSRKAVVPEHVISHMLEELVPPTPTEAQRVGWLCV